MACSLLVYVRKIGAEGNRKLPAVPITVRQLEAIVHLAGFLSTPLIVV